MNTTNMKDQLKTRKLTKSQLDLLKLLYKFRFATTTLLASHRHKNPVTIYGTLQVLLKSQLIAKHYNPSYKLAGRGAEYYIANKGIRFLRDNENLNKSVLHAMYKNKSLSQTFIQKCLLIYQIYIQFIRQYGPAMKIYTKSEMQGIDGFPKQLPDMYITTDANTYFLDIFTDNLFFLVKKRLNALVKHYESGEWMGATYPVILLALKDSSLEGKTNKYIDNIIEYNSYKNSEFICLATTIDGITTTNFRICSEKMDAEGLLSIH